MTLTRRTLCRTAVAVSVSVLTGCGASRYRGPERTITIAGGQPGGLYLEVAQLLADKITAAEPHLRCSTVMTNGSVENVERIGSGDADVGVCQADVALDAVAGAGSFLHALPLRGIGRMYEEYLQLVVRDDSELTSITQLTGRTVSLGAVRSGTTETGKRLMAAAGVEVVSRPESLEVAADALAARKVDAVLWCGGVPTPKLVALHEKIRIRLLPLAAMLPAMRKRYPLAYQQVRIPAGGYGQSGKPTIGVANLLLCGRSLPDDVVAAITEVLVEHAAQLVPTEARGTQFLDRRALICLLGVPMHPGAATAYRQLHG
jgi:uncharacterized protein